MKPKAFSNFPKKPIEAPCRILKTIQFLSHFLRWCEGHTELFRQENYIPWCQNAGDKIPSLPPYLDCYSYQARYMDIRTSGGNWSERSACVACTWANIAFLLSILGLYFSPRRRLTGVLKFCMGITSAQRLILCFKKGAEKKDIIFGGNITFASMQFYRAIL